MKGTELDLEVSDLLLTASRFSDYPSAAMAYCRKATECIIHSWHYQQYGQYPKPDDNGNYPSLSGVISTVRDSLHRQTVEILFSINAQSRGELHWDFENKGKVAKSRHVEAVIAQISAAYSDLYDKDLAIGEIKTEWVLSEETVKRVLHEQINESGIEKRESERAQSTGRNLDAILEIADSAIEVGVDFDYGEENQLGLAAELAGKWDIAEGYYKQALQGYSRDGDILGEVKSLNNLAYLLFQKGSLDEAEKLAKRGLELSKETDFTDDAATSLNQLGNIAEARDDLDEAEAMYNQSMEIYRRTGNRRRQAAVTNNLGVLESIRGNNLAAMSFFRDGNTISREAGDKGLEAKTLANLGMLNFIMNEHSSSREQLERSYQLYKEIGDVQGQSTALAYKGELFYGTGLIKEGICILREALELDRLIGDAETIAEDSFRLGVWSFEQGDYQDAEELFREHLRCCQDGGKDPEEWLVKYGYIDPGAEWVFPPKEGGSEGPICLNSWSN